MTKDQILNDDELDLVVGGRPTGPCDRPQTGPGNGVWNQFAGGLVSGVAAGVGAVLGIL